VIGNGAGSEGGGAYFGNCNETILTNNSFAGNDGEGARFYHCEGPTLTNNTFITSSEKEGRVEFNYCDGVTLTNNTFGKNSTVSLYKCDGMILTNNTFCLNAGGGAYIYACEGLTLTNNTFSENSATGTNKDGGGALFISCDGLTLTNNTFSGNSTGTNGDGGGVCVDFESSEGITLTNNTFCGNFAEENGGGIYILLWDDSGYANIYNNIFWNNYASTEGRDLWIDNDGNGNFFPSTVNLFHNNFDQSAAGIYIRLPFPIDPSNLDNVDPLFVDPGSGNFHLLEGSLCINAGDNSAPELPATDMDGQPRIIDYIVDIGADEYPGAGPPTADFSAEPTSGEIPLEVNFTDESVGDVTSWEWDFGDESPHSHDQNPVHTYNEPGSYTVTLSVTGSSGSWSPAKTITELRVNSSNSTVPDAQVNGNDGPVFVFPEDMLEMTISLDPGSLSGVSCDYWIGIMSPFGIYWFNPPWNWTKSDTPISFGQFPLYNLPKTQILTHQLPEGLYMFFFVIDDTPDGNFGITWYDYVNVICQPGGRQMESLPDFDAIFHEKMKKFIEK